MLRLARVVAVVWAAVLIICWIQGSPPEWPPPVEWDEIFPLSRRCTFGPGYTLAALGLLSLAIWDLWRMVRRQGEGER